MESELARVGLLYRLFARVKTWDSIRKKIELKGNEYKYGRKMQDLIGVRVALYFSDDIEIARKSFSINYKEKSEDSSIDELKKDVFGPVRYNVIYELGKPYNGGRIIEEMPIDHTFEVQFRTILSEGWHEVEHDLRYKCKSDWDLYPMHSRALNSVYATLENCDSSMNKIFYDLSLSSYKKKSWDVMLRNKFRIRFSDDSLSIKMRSFLDSNPRFAKSLFNMERNEFMIKLLESRIDLPLTFDNVVLLSNRLCIKERSILALENSIFSDICQNWSV